MSIERPVQATSNTLSNLELLAQLGYEKTSKNSHFRFYQKNYTLYVSQRDLTILNKKAKCKKCVKHRNTRKSVRSEKKETLSKLLFQS